MAAFEVVSTGSTVQHKFPNGTCCPKIGVLTEGAAKYSRNLWLLVGETMIDSKQIVFTSRVDHGLQSPKDVVTPGICIMTPILSGANKQRFTRVEEGTELHQKAKEYWQQFRATS
jgi:hypothetical protein